MLASASASRVDTASGRRAHDARAGEAIVEAAMVAAEQRQETETGGSGEEQPDDGACDRAAEVERSGGLGPDDADAGRHLAERLSACGERDQVTAVLHEQERQQR